MVGVPEIQRLPECVMQAADARLVIPMFLMLLLGVYLTLQAPDVAYPAHAHPAVELYQVVSGTATWWRTSDGQQRRLPGEVLLHGSGEAHAMRTWGMPLLSVCIWLDALDRPSRMVDGEAVNRKGSDPF